MNGKIAQEAVIAVKIQMVLSRTKGAPWFFEIFELDEFEPQAVAAVLAVAAERMDADHAEFYRKQSMAILWFFERGYDKMATIRAAAAEQVAMR